MLNELATFIHNRYVPNRQRNQPHALVVASSKLRVHWVLSLALNPNAVCIKKIVIFYENNADDVMYLPTYRPTCMISETSLFPTQSTTVGPQATYRS